MNDINVEILKAQVARLPADPGVYIFRDRKGQMLYVGKSKELRTRVRSYFQVGGDGRPHLHLWLDRIAELETIITQTEQEALILENNLIKKHRPRFNIVLRDDDFITSNHRGHGHYLAKGGDLRGLIAELYCRTTGCAKGRGGF